MVGNVILRYLKDPKRKQRVSLRPHLSLHFIVDYNRKNFVKQVTYLSCDVIDQTGRLRLSPCLQ